MGNCSFKSDTLEQIDQTCTTMSKNNYVFHYVIGRGGFGKVWRVEKKKNG